MNTWTIKNSLGQTVESRFACDTTDPDEALRRYSFTPSVAEKCKELGQKPLGSATLNLTGRIVTWTHARTRHFAEVVSEEGTMVAVQFGDKTPLLRRDAVELAPETVRFETTPWPVQLIDAVFSLDFDGVFKPSRR